MLPEMQKRKGETFMRIKKTPNREIKYNPLKLDRSCVNANDIWYMKDVSEYDAFDITIKTKIYREGNTIYHFSKKNAYDIFEKHASKPENWKDTNCMKCSLLKDRKYCPIHDQNLSKWTGYKGLCGFFVPKEKSDISQTMSDKCLTPK